MDIKDYAVVRPISLSIKEKVLTKTGAQLESIFLSSEVDSDEKFEYWQAIEEHHIKKVYEHLQNQDDTPLMIQGTLLQAVEFDRQDWFNSKKRGTLKFADLLRSELRAPKVQQVSTFLLFIWLEYLSFDLQYHFWFRKMNAYERCRLWNALVLPMKYFQEVYNLSKDHKVK